MHYNYSFRLEILLSLVLRSLWTAPLRSLCPCLSAPVQVSSRPLTASTNFELVL